jgi:hypothetical protein
MDVDKQRARWKKDWETVQTEHAKAAHPNRGCRSWGLKPPDSRRHLAL